MLVSGVEDEALLDFLGESDLRIAEAVGREIDQLEREYFETVDGSSIAKALRAAMARDRKAFTLVTPERYAELSKRWWPSRPDRPACGARIARAGAPSCIPQSLLIRPAFHAGSPSPIISP
jgi:hypothetical protein